MHTGLPVSVQQASGKQANNSTCTAGAPLHFVASGNIESMNNTAAPTPTHDKANRA
jgi:hypothetical protein